MPLIQVFVVLVILGVVLYLVNAMVPMVPWVKQVINVLAGLIVFLWLLQVFGVWTGFHTVHLR